MFLWFYFGAPKFFIKFTKFQFLHVVFKYHDKFYLNFNNFFFNYYVYDIKLIILKINCS